MKSWLHRIDVEALVVMLVCAVMLMLFMTELRVYTHDMQLLQSKPLLTATESAAMDTYASNFAVALCLTTNSAALSAYLTATGCDITEAWWPWRLGNFVVCVVLLGDFAALFIIFSIRFVRRLLGYQSKRNQKSGGACRDQRCAGSARATGAPTARSIPAQGIAPGNERDDQRALTGRR
jgi:hypothetical protein